MKTGESDNDNLTLLAGAYGIQCSYWDIWGGFHEIPLKTLEQMLQVMGVDVGRPQEALHLLESRSWSQLAEPVLIESIERLPAELVFQVPADRLPGKQLDRKLRVRLVIDGENISSLSYSYESEQLTFNEAKHVDGVGYERWSVPFPQGLAAGYYQFKLTVAFEQKKHQQTIPVILCPDQAYLPPDLEGDGKRAGIAIALYGLRSQRNWGVGDFSDLKEFIRWVISSMHVDVIGLNPLHAISNRQPYNISPYFPSSRFYRNFIYLDIEAMEDYCLCPEAKELVQAEATQVLLAELRDSELVQYEQVAALKLQVLNRVFQAFLQEHWSNSGEKTEHLREFEAYMIREGALLDNFATFCALEVFLHQEDATTWTWQQWPEPFQDPLSEEVRKFRQSHWESILFYKYLQWQLEAQLQDAQDLAHSMGACIGLYHDLALGVDPGGADHWAYRDFFVEGVTVGAPPDDFALEGQDWGFHPPYREHYRYDGYHLFVQEVKKNCQAGGALRIDHIMRFFRLFWITAGKPAKDGTYVENYYQDLLKILALESERAKVLIIGEDLGTVPPQVRENLAHFGIFSYRLFFFEKDELGGFNPAESYPPFALAAVSTHDLPTLAGFWTDQDILIRNELGMFPSEAQFRLALQKRKEEKEKIIQRLATSGFLSEELTNTSKIYAELTAELHNAIIGFLLSTPAKLAILSQEDLFKDARQQNVPGTVSEHPNWSTKMSYSLEELWQDAKVDEYVRLFRNWIDLTERSMQTSS
jgi:4-alpha-glucanotransferase